MKLFLGASAAFLCLVSFVYASPAKAMEISLNMTNAPLRELLRTATKAMNKSYQAEADLCERFSIVSPADMSRHEAQVTMEFALLSHGYTLVSKPGYDLVKSVRSATSDSPKPECQRALNDIVTRVFRLKRLSTAAALKLISSHMSKEVLMDEVPAQNSIIVSDDAAFIERARSILKSHDPIADL